MYRYCTHSADPGAPRQSPLVLAVIEPPASETPPTTETLSPESVHNLQTRYLSKFMPAVLVTSCMQHPLEFCSFAVSVPSRWTAAYCVTADRCCLDATSISSHHPVSYSEFPRAIQVDTAHQSAVPLMLRLRERPPFIRALILTSNIPHTGHHAKPCRTMARSCAVNKTNTIS